MKRNNLIEKIDFLLFGHLINLFYPQYFRPRYGYQNYVKLFFHYLIPQYIFRLNPKVKWPVHFTSKIVCPERIEKGILCDPGDSLHNYIQANNGINFGSNIEIGPGVKIISSNHSIDNFRQHILSKPITIGNNVWIGANSVVLPMVNIGNNVIIGAGSIVVNNIPSNSIAVGNPCKVIKSKEAYSEDLSKITFNRSVPPKYFSFLKKGSGSL